MLWGLPFLLYGYRFARELLFPCGYLFLAIPLNFIDSMTAPLRLFATAASAFLLNGLGLKVVRVGAGLYSGAGNPFAFNVAPECSGLHSLLAMTALMAFYAWYTQKRSPANGFYSSAASPLPSSPTPAASFWWWPWPPSGARNAPWACGMTIPATLFSSSALR